MHDEDGSSLSRRLHWDEQDASEPGGAPPDDAPNHQPVEVRPVEALPVADGFDHRGWTDPNWGDKVALDRRRQLWRDTAILLSGLVVALLVANLVFPQIAGLAGGGTRPRPGRRAPR